MVFPETRPRERLRGAVLAVGDPGIAKGVGLVSVAGVSVAQRFAVARLLAQPPVLGLVGVAPPAVEAGAYRLQARVARVQRLAAVAEHQGPRDVDARRHVEVPRFRGALRLVAKRVQRGPIELVRPKRMLRRIRAPRAERRRRVALAMVRRLPARHVLAAGHVLVGKPARAPRRPHVHDPRPRRLHHRRALRTVVLRLRRALVLGPHAHALEALLARTLDLVPFLAPQQPRHHQLKRVRVGRRQRRDQGSSMRVIEGASESERLSARRGGGRGGRSSAHAGRRCSRKREESRCRGDDDHQQQLVEDRQTAGPDRGQAFTHGRRRTRKEEGEVVRVYAIGGRTKERQKDDEAG